MRGYGRLALRIRTRGEEPAVGALARLSWRHGMADTRSFSRMIGLPFGEVRAGRMTQVLAEAAGLDPESLLRCSAVQDAASRRIHVSGERVRSLDWNGNERRWCPVCLRDDLALARRLGLDPGVVVSHRSWWDASPIQSCPVHRVALEGRCRRCRSAPDWSVAPLHVCRCGAGLDAVPARHATTRLVDTMLHARLCGYEPPDLGPFGTTPLDEVLPLMRWLGLASVLPWSERWPRTRQAEGVDVLEIGANMMRDWPGSFVEVLNRGLSRRRTRHGNRAGMIANYGWVHEQFVSRSGQGPAGIALRTVLRDHAVASGIVSSGEAVLGFAASDDSVGLVEAGRMLGMGFERTRRLLRSDGRTPSASRRGVRHDISRRHVLLLSQRRSGMGMQELGRRLGVGRKATRGLVVSGLFDAARTTAQDGAAFDPDGVSTILASLVRTPSPRSLPPDSCVDPVEATRLCGLDLVQLIDRVAEGAIEPVRWPVDGVLADARFVREDVAKLRPRSPKLTLSAVAVLLDLHPEAATTLARDGVLRGERTGRSWVFAAEDVVRFSEAYVTAKELATATGMSPKALVARRREAGLHPFRGPPHCRQVIYRRDEVAQIGNDAHAAGRTA